jgi:sigma-E factor negative regulatory protein RseB
MRRFSAGLFLLATLVSAGTLADPDPEQPDALDLLLRMSAAVRDVNYDGVFIYSHAHRTDSMRIIHRGGPGEEQERLISLTGQPREVVRTGGTVTSYYPDTQAVMVEKTRPRNFVVQLPPSMEDLAAHYTFSVNGSDRMAGRNAWVVGILPRDVYRYGYQIWVDQENHLPLRTELRSRAGMLIEEVMFTHLEVLDAIPDEVLRPGISGQGFTWFHGAAAEASGDTAGGRWQARWVPEGFRVSRYERQALVASGDPVDHIVYSDGMASVSVFVERLREAPPQVGPRRIGGINAFGKLAHGHQITAVGEVPPATVQRIANSMVSE